jgi:hypothetical protein
MNIILWIVQIALALHTATGAVWKFEHSDAIVPSLLVIPHEAWIVISIIELILAVFLVIPLFKRSWAALAPQAATVIMLQMLLYCAIHLSSGSTDYMPISYWLVVAAVAAFVAYGRFVLRPIA